MSLLRRIFDRAYREAKRAEGRGAYRDAAVSYVEADLPDEAARVLMILAARSNETSERVDALEDALHLIAPDHPGRGALEEQIGITLLEEAQAHGVESLAERRSAEKAAKMLERNGCFAHAATAYEVLERPDDVARCLEAGGEIERLERFLADKAVAGDRERALRGSLRAYEMAMASGARNEALHELEEAEAAAPEDASVREMLVRLRRRFPPRGTLRVAIEGDEQLFIEGAEVTLGRDGQVPLRGASVSRRHTRLFLRDGQLMVEDLGSRNGTLMSGLAIASEMALAAKSTIGLGDDVHLQVEAVEGGFSARVVRGLDAGLWIRVGRKFSSSAFTVHFDGGAALLQGKGATELDGEPVVAPIVCLRDDVIEVDGLRIEVR